MLTRRFRHAVDIAVMGVIGIAILFGTAGLAAYCAVLVFGWLR